MVKKDYASISIASCPHSWDEIDERAKKLGFDRSKYIQRLIDLDLAYNMLDDYDILKMIKTGGYKHIRKVIYILIGLLFITMFFMWVVFLGA